jgi:hypothetical protein
LNNSEATRTGYFQPNEDESRFVVITSGIVAALIGLASAGVSATASGVKSSRQVEAAREASRKAMLEGVSKVIVAREQTKAKKADIASGERRTTGWIIAILCILFITIIVITIIKRKKQNA